MKRLLLIIALLLAPVAALAQTPAATTNGAVTITTGGTFQTVLSALSSSGSRHSLTIQNNNTNGDNCWIYVGSGTATAGSGTYTGAMKSAFGLDSASMTAILNAGTKATTANPWSISGNVYIGNRSAGDRSCNCVLQKFAFGTIKGQYDNLTAP